MSAADKSFLDTCEQTASLTEYIRNKVDNIRESKRLDHEKYLSLLKEAIRCKTENVAIAYREFENAVRNYQALLECRLENYVTQSLSKNDAQLSNAYGTALKPSIIDISSSLHNDSRSLVLEGENCLDVSNNTNLSENTAYETSANNSLTYSEKINKARLLCLETKKNYDLLEASLRRANGHISTVRDKYHKNLLSFNNLEKDLTGVSSTFESKAKVDLESNLKSLSKDFSFERPHYKTSEFQTLDDEDIKMNNKRKATDLSNSSKALFGAPSQDRIKVIPEYPESVDHQDFPAKKTIPALVLFLTLGYCLTSIIPGFN